MPTSQEVYDELWPEPRHRAVSVVRVGMDRFTGKILMGEAHEFQSLTVIFATAIHTRVLRRWVGSFVPVLLGRSAVPRAILRFYWAIFIALDLWEPNVRVRRVKMLRRDGVDTNDPAESLTSTEELRSGHATFRLYSVRRPRGHLGDETEEGRRTYGIIGRGRGVWERLRGPG